MKKLDKHAVSFTAEEAAEMGLRMAAGTTNAAEAAAEAGFGYVTGNATVWIDNPKAFLKLIEDAFPELIIAMLRQRLEDKNITIQELVSILAQAQAQQAGAALPELDPTNQRIWNWIKDDSSITDDEIGRRLGVSRQTVNARRQKIISAGYPAKRRVS